MGQKITITFDTDGSGEGNFFQIDNGIKAVKAIKALEYLTKSINEKLVERAIKHGLSKETAEDEMNAFFADQMLEELF